MSGGTELCVIKTNGALHPCDARDRDIFSRIPNEKPFTVKCKIRRSAKQHRLAFALINTVRQATHSDMSEKAFLDALKMETGLVETVKLFNGVAIQKPASISWSAMPQDEFSEWFERALSALDVELVKCGKDVLRDEINKQLGRPL